MKNKEKDSDDNYYTLKKLERNATTMETKRNKEAFDQIMNFNNSNKKYMGSKKNISV